jgi:protein tyrosine phosphatase (PTP) superfamily phosphohydrolase (DUF442 family)
MPNRLLLGLLLLPMLATSAELAEIRNYKAYSPDFASAGQPTEAQLQAVSDAGFDQVVYIAMSNSRSAVDGEDVIVKELGMDYVHIPVIWDAPTMADFYAFASIMRREPDAKTLLHCAANYRASAFAFLYRVIYEDVSVAVAKADMNEIWSPNETWRNLIFEVLADNGISPDCDGCDWSSED